MPPLHVAIVWHMHQPYYRQPGSHFARLPWVRLHAIKDYLHMADVVAHYPDVHVSITVVPSLAEQLLAYAGGEYEDRLMLLARQPYFSPDDKRYLLNLCFSVDWDYVIRRYQPYAALLDRRHLALLNPDYFSEQTYRDLIVWFSLGWTDPNQLENDDFLRELIHKGQGFSIAEAEALMAWQQQIMGRVLPRYRQLQDQGQLELLTVPYFHPILPLLIDSRIGQRPSPGLPVIDPPFQAPDDAAGQIAAAVQLHTEIFGRPPRGLWPAEGAVAPEILPLVARHGIRWLATDEAILGHSLGVYFQRDRNERVTQPELLYRPYRVPAGHGDLSMIFRDHQLSDRVGFVYHGLPGEQAAEDMIVRLKQIHHALRHQPEPGLVSIILDGENAWEHFEHNGDIFLHALYRHLQEDPDLQAVTVSEHLQAYPPASALEHLASGSWIRGDFTTWIGDPEHNEAWARLRDLRQAYEHWRQGNPPADLQARVQKLIWAAEGSDWFWWYSHHNSSEQDDLFDEAFLDFLAAAYELMGIVPPPDALTPIQGISARRRRVPTLISPRLTAHPDPTRQWAGAQLLMAAASGGVMQQAGDVWQALRYGNDARYLYLRLESTVPLSGHPLEIELQRSGQTYRLSLGAGQSTAFLYAVEAGQQVSLGPVQTALAETICELAIPLMQLGLFPLPADSELWLRAQWPAGSADAHYFPANQAARLRLAAVDQKAVFSL